MIVIRRSGSPTRDIDAGQGMLDADVGQRGVALAAAVGENPDPVPRGNVRLRIKGDGIRGARTDRLQLASHHVDAGAMGKDLDRPLAAIDHQGGVSAYHDARCHRWLVLTRYREGRAGRLVRVGDRRGKDVGTARRRPGRDAGGKIPARHRGRAATGGKTLLVQVDRRSLRSAPRHQQGRRHNNKAQLPGDPQTKGGARSRRLAPAPDLWLHSLPRHGSVRPQAVSMVSAASFDVRRPVLDRQANCAKL